MMLHRAFPIEIEARLPDPKRQAWLAAHWLLRRSRLLGITGADMTADRQPGAEKA